MSLQVSQLVGFNYGALAAAATATATATATGGSAITVTSLGTSTSKRDCTSVSLAVPSAVPAGSMIIVGAGSGSVYNVTSVTDGKNSYILGTQKIHTGGPMAALAYAQNCTALTATDIIHVSFSNTNGTGRVMVVGYASAMLSSGSFIDQNASAAGASSSPSSGNTSTTTQASELSIGIVASDSGFSVTQPSGYTEIGNADASVGSPGVHISLAYKTLTATGAQVFAPTLGGSSDWVCIVETLKGA